jgi:hypothetical protein
MLKTVIDLLPHVCCACHSDVQATTIAHIKVITHGAHTCTHLNDLQRFLHVYVVVMLQCYCSCWAEQARPRETTAR